MKKILLLVVSALMAGHVFAQEIQNPEAKNAGNAAWKAKNYVEAYTQWDAYLKANNYSDAACCYNAATAANKAKKYAEAIAYYDKAIAAKYKVASAYSAKAKVYKAQGDEAKYIAEIETAMKAVPNNATLEKMYATHYLLEGQEAQKANKVAEAEAAYNKVIGMTNRGYKSQGMTIMAQMIFNNGVKVQEAATKVMNTDKEKFEAGKAEALAAYNKALELCMQAISTSNTNTDATELKAQIDTAIANLNK
ncbi:MAG: hypothetical protein E7071_08770 [Bacteroidales bacterium]|nr:hypothetical protein [Bacteroidales bacterium]